MTTATPADWRAVHLTTSEPTVVVVDGLRFVVPPVPLTDLLVSLSAGNPGGIIPGLLPPDQMATWFGHLFNPRTRFDLQDANTVTFAVVEHLCGVPAQTAVTLAGWLTVDWLLLDGYHLARGVDLLTLPPRRLFATLYAFLIEHRYEKREDADRDLFPVQLRAPTAGEMARDGHNFMAAMAVVGGMGPAG